MKTPKFLTILSVAATFMLTSCGTTSPLYYWGLVTNDVSAYENLTYRYFEEHSPESLCRLISMYEGIVSSPGGMRNVPPPGVCAEYGYLLLKPESAEIFAEHANLVQKRRFRSDNYASLFPEIGKQMIEKEMQLYPESAKFLAPLLESLTK